MSVDLGAVIEGLKLLCVPLSRQIGYLKNLNQNMAMLRFRMNALRSKADDITIEVNSGESRGKNPQNEVSNWLKEVEYIKMQVNDIEKNFT